MDTLVLTSVTEEEPPEKAKYRTANQRVNLPQDPHLRAEFMHQPILEDGVEMRIMNIRRKTEQLQYRTSDGV